MDTKQPGRDTVMNNAALYYHPDGYRTDGKKLMGRQAAGESFLRGYLAYADTDTVYAYCPGGRHYADFTEFCAEHDKAETKRGIGGIINHDMAPLKKVGGLFIPGPNIDEFTWKRRRGHKTDFSITGVTHTTASEGAMVHLANLVTIPCEPWDAVICTSTSVRKTADRIIDGYRDYLHEHVGVAANWRPQLELPVIPLGIFADDIDKPADIRAAHRKRLRAQLGMADHDIAVLFVGRLSFHAKANPLPMLIALETTANALPDRRIHLIQAGWYANDAIENAFKENEETFAPSVVHHRLNGRDQDIRFNIWHAADIFCSLADNIQETFGLTPVEAMAAGLPTVVTDWDGYRDTIVHQETGFRIATILPPREAGVPMAQRYEDSKINYDQYCAESSMASAVDIRQTTEAFMALAQSSELRQRLGDAGRRRVRALYDWRKVVPQYQALWAELSARRLAAQQDDKTRTIHSQAPANPYRQNPFDLFAEYPSSQLTMGSRVYPGEVNQEIIRKLARSVMVNLNGSDYIGATKLAQSLLNAIRESGAEGVVVSELMARLDEAEQLKAPSSLGWLLKIGAIRPADEMRKVTIDTTGPATPSAEQAAE